MKRDWISGILLISAAPLLVVGLWMPVISVRSMLVFHQEFSLLDGVIAFLRGGDYFLFAVVGLFTVLLPALKIGTALMVWTLGLTHGWAPRLVSLFEKISRWSMLDVLVVALTILFLEGSLVTRADIGLGIVLFGGAVILSTIATHRLARSHVRPVDDSV
ncbi:MAG: paraquat-inducible protein A [Alphaproteobacteria bacterium]